MDRFGHGLKLSWKPSRTKPIRPVDNEDIGYKMPFADGRKMHHPPTLLAGGSVPEICDELNSFSPPH
jgi:hypothetical protein